MTLSFNQSSPFVESYEKYYEYALNAADIVMLNVHSEAIYYIIDDFQISQTVSKLVQIASMHPLEEFVESLAFYLSDRSRQLKYLHYMCTVDSKERISIAKAAIHIAEQLQKK